MRWPLIPRRTGHARGTRYLWLKNRLTERQQALREDLLSQRHLKTARAFRLKLALQEFYEQPVVNSCWATIPRPWYVSTSKPIRQQARLNDKDWRHRRKQRPWQGHQGVSFTPSWASTLVALASQFAVLWSILGKRTWEFGLRRCLGVGRSRLMLETAVGVTLLSLPAFTVVIPLTWFILNSLVRPSILTLTVADAPAAPPGSIGAVLTAVGAAAAAVTMLVWVIALIAAYETSRLDKQAAAKPCPARRERPGMSLVLIARGR